jgi:nucleotide-binding universal stress UspA family protein
LTVFHAIYAVPFQYDEAFYHDTLKALKKELAPRILDSAVDILKFAQAKISVEIEESPPPHCAAEECIIRAAEASGMDLIVMGARGVQGAASAFFIGSVSRRVAMDSSKPVLVVKPALHPPSGAMKILFATDGLEPSRATGRLLSGIPFPDDAEIIILNIVASGFADIPERFALEVNERTKDAIAGSRAIELSRSKKILEQARDDFRRRFKNVQVLSRVGDPSSEILNLGDALGADLIAVGSRGLRGIKGLLGSVSWNVLTHAKGSVIIGKQG